VAADWHKLTLPSTDCINGQLDTRCSCRYNTAAFNQTRIGKYVFQCKYAVIPAKMISSVMLLLLLQAWKVDTPISRQYSPWKLVEQARAVLVWPSRVHQRRRWTAATTEMEVVQWNTCQPSLATMKLPSSLLTDLYLVSYQHFYNTAVYKIR